MLLILADGAGAASAAKHVAESAIPATHSVPMASPHDPPRIVTVAMSQRSLRGGQTVSGYVTTSSNVASVEARVQGYSAVFSKIGVGQFTLSYTVPLIAQAFRGTYPLYIIARNVDGVQDRREMPVTVR